MANDDCSQQSEKIASLEKDVEAMSTKMSEKGACSVSPRIDAIETRLSNQATRLAVLDKSVETANGSLAGLQASVKELDTTIADINARLGQHDTVLAVLKGSIESANNSLVGVQKSLKDMESMLSDNISQLHAKQNKLFTTQAENRAMQSGPRQRGPCLFFAPKVRTTLALKRKPSLYCCLFQFEP